jgi:competence protein ComEC
MTSTDPATNVNTIGIRGWERCSRAPFVALTTSFALGILLSNIHPRCSFPVLSIAAGTLALASAAASAVKRQRCALLTSLFSILLAGAVTALAQRQGIPPDDVRVLTGQGLLPLHELVQFEGCVSNEGTVQQEDAVFTLGMRAVNIGKLWKSCRGDVLVRVPVLPSGEDVPGASVRYGDRVRGWAQFDLPHVFRNPGSPDRRQILARRGIYLTASVKSPRLLEVIPGDCGLPWLAAGAGIRRHIRKSLDTLSGSGRRREAAILASTLIGDYSGLDEPTMEAFQNSGTLHVLVVSGLHVGWIAWALLRLLRLLRCPEPAGRLVAAFTVLMYTFTVGIQASISRSLWMFILYICGQALFRRASPENIASASALLLLAANPVWLFDPGFQLSFLSVLAICLLGGPLVQDWVRPLLNPLRQAGNPERLFLERGRFHRLGRSFRVRAELFIEELRDRWGLSAAPALCRAVRLAASACYAITAMMLVSLSVQAWIEPVLACSYNRLSWISSAANVVVVPLSSLVLAFGAASVTIASLFPACSGLLVAAAWSASLLYQVTRWVAGIPWGWQRCPTPPPVFACAAVLVVVAWCFFRWRSRWFPCTVAGTFFLSLASADCWPKIDAASSALELTFLDVGQGDAAVLSFPDGRTWIVDAGGLGQGNASGESIRTFDTGERIVSRYLWSRWITRIDRVVLSHPHHDHGGGVPAVLANFRSGSFYTSALNPEGDAVLAHITRVARERSIPVLHAQAGDEVRPAGVHIRTLHPPLGSNYRSPNESSIVLHIRYGRFAALLPGDLERQGERSVLASNGNLRSLLLKVAHHGSRYATPDDFLDQVRPRWAILSAGRHNPFGNPARDLVMRLLRRGIRPLLTMDHGAISISTDGERFVLRSHVCGVLESGFLPATP